MGEGSGKSQVWVLCMMAPSRDSHASTRAPRALVPASFSAMSNKIRHLPISTAARPGPRVWYESTCTHISGNTHIPRPCTQASHLQYTFASATRSQWMKMVLDEMG
jgi:hypothetical protein